MMPILLLCSVQEYNKVGGTLVKCSREVASALVYLSAKGFIHRDLAARNILVSIDGVCKVRHMHAYNRQQHSFVTLS